MLPDDLLSIVSQPVSAYMQQARCGIVWLDPARLTPLALGGEKLTKDQMLSLVSAAFGSPVEANSALPVVKDRIGAEALDLLASEVVAQAFQRPKVSSQGHPVGVPPFFFDIAARIGSRQTALAIRKSAVLSGDYLVVPALLALLAIEQAHAIGFCAEATRNSPSYYASTVDAAIGKMCSRLGISEQERELRSLPADSSKKKVAEKALEALFTGGFAWDQQTFEGTVLDHPVLLEAARGLVWGELALDGTARNLFRITESKDLTNIVGEPASPRFPVVTVHPAQVESAQVEAWSSLWARAKLAAPFAQWRREFVRPAEAVLPAEPISPSALLVSLESRGWKRGVVEKGMLNHHSKEFPHLKTTAQVRYSGVPVSFGGEWQPQRLVVVEFRSGDEPLPMEKASPLAISTVYSDLRFVAREV